MPVQQCRQRHGNNARMVHVESICTSNPAGQGKIVWLNNTLDSFWRRFFSLMQAFVGRTPVVHWLMRKVIASVSLHGVRVVLVVCQISTLNYGRLFHSTVKLRAVPFQACHKVHKHFTIITWKITIKLIAGVKRILFFFLLSQMISCRSEY